MTRKQRNQKIVVSIGFILLGVSAGFVMSEMVARLLPPPYQQDEFNPNVLVQCERQVGWRGLTGTSVTINTEGNQHKVTWNSQGLHDGEHPIAKDDGVFRIMILGDSFLEALQVEEHETSHQVLEDNLNALPSSTIKFEVISAGVSGWGPAQELAYFRTEGKAFEPDLLLVFWYPGNDLKDNLPDYRRTSRAGVNCYAPYFAVCQGEFDLDPWYSVPGFSPTWRECSLANKYLTTFFNYLYSHSRLYQHLEPLLTDEADRIKYDPVFLPWLERASQDDVLKYSYQLTTNIYTALAAEASQKGIETVFIIVPYKLAVYSEIDPNFVKLLQEEAPGVENAIPILPNQEFVKRMEVKGLPILDLHPPFVDYVQRGGETPYWQGDNHWNVIGNRLAAEIIGDWLIERKFVPVKE